MFPNSPESWLILLIACAAGFVIGQWINKRRRAADKDSIYIEGLKKHLLAEQRAAAKKGGKKRNDARHSKGK